MALCIEQWMSQGMPTALARELKLNLGGTFYKDLTFASHTVTVPDEVQNIRHVLSGSILGDRIYTFPLVSGFFFVDNQTTGGHVVTLAVAGGNAITIASNQRFIIFVDAFLSTIEPIVSTDVTANITHLDTIYSIPDSIGNVSADSTVGDVSIVIPSAILWPSRTIGIVRTVNDNAVLLTSAGGKIQGISGTYPLNGMGDSLRLNSNGTDWWSL